MTAVTSNVFGAGTGTVVAFDDHVGTGTLRDSTDGREWWFHCTRLVGGDRTIQVGTEVTYRLDPGPTGIEAVEVTVVD